MKKNNSARLGLIIVAIIWGSGFDASALALDNFSTNQILAFRFTIAFIISLIVYLKDLRYIDLRSFRNGSIIGLFLFLSFMFQTQGLVYTTASKNAFLTAVNIVIVPFLGFLIFRNKIEKKELIEALITLAGIAFISFDNDGFGSLNKGDLLTLICAFFFALQIFYTDYYVKSSKIGIIMIAQMGTAVLLSWIFVLINNELNFNLSIVNFAPILYLGLVSTMLAYGIQTWTQKRINGAEAAVILSTEAFFGMIASVIILKEHITENLYIGGFLIFLGVLIIQLDFKKKIAIK